MRVCLKLQNINNFQIVEGVRGKPEKLEEVIKLPYENLISFGIRKPPDKFCLH